MRTSGTENPFWEDKGVIVTGCGGFIGQHITRFLLRRNARVLGMYHSTKPIFLQNDFDPGRLHPIKKDLCRSSKLPRNVREFSNQFEVMIHCAGLDGNTQFKLDYTAQIMSENTRMTLNVLQMCIDYNIKNIVLLSSAEIYDPSLTGIINEDDDYSKRAITISNGYVLSKIFAEVTAELFSKQHGISVFLPRLGNVYGPGDHYGDAPARVIPTMIQKLANNEDIEIWGDGKQQRQFMYVEDVANAILGIIEKGHVGTINIAAKEPTSILDLANMIADEVGAKTNRVSLDLTKPSGAAERILATERMIQSVGLPPTSLRDGLRSTVEWYNAMK